MGIKDIKDLTCVVVRHVGFALGLLVLFQMTTISGESDWIYSRCRCDKGNLDTCDSKHLAVKKMRKHKCFGTIKVKYEK